MASSPLILAALAKAAVPSSKFKQAKSIPREPGDVVNSALLTDADGIQYIVREARNAKGNLKLATETQCLRAVKGAGALPFRVPNLISETTTPDGHTLQILDFVYGSTSDLDNLRSNEVVLRQIGSTLAAIHSLSLEKIRQAGLPEFTPAETREARTAELDRAAATGRVPAALLQRWESALEDLDLFRFKPTVVHGNITTGSILELDGEVSGVLGWSNLHIGDPAEDLGTFAANVDEGVLDSIKMAYFEHRSEADSKLALRAVLYSELAIASYLVSSLSEGRIEDAEWATTELEAIASQVEGGTARALTTVGFASVAPVALEEAEELFVTDTHTIVTVVNDELDVSDLKTRPIELPKSSDDQLF